jgi:serine/threonine-protein phosphatase 2A regulatory subunit B
LFLLSVGLLCHAEKTVKLWKVGHRRENYLIEEEEEINPASFQGTLFTAPSPAKRYARVKSAKDLKLPMIGRSGNSDGALDVGKQQVYSHCRASYANAHVYNINSVSIHQDGQSFLSADDLRVNIWNLEDSSRCFNLVDLKPESMEELSEVVTCAAYHPTDSSLLCYATSRGAACVIDTRMRSLVDKNTVLKIEASGARSFGPRDDRSVVLHCDSLHDSQDARAQQNSPASQLSRLAAASSAVASASSTAPLSVEKSTSFFSEMITSVSDVKVSQDGRYLFTRDFMTIKMWDLVAPQRRKAEPVLSIDIHEYLQPKLTHLYENDAIFDRFGMALSPDGQKVLTGSYGNQFHVFDTRSGARMHHCDVSAAVVRKERGGGSGASPSARGKTGPPTKDMDLDKKVLSCAWGPDGTTVSVAGHAGLYLYKA